MKSISLLFAFSALFFCSEIYADGSCPVPVTFSLSATGESCTGCCDGSIQVINLTGGCAPYLITLNPTGQTSNNGVFQNLCSMLYTVTVQELCCTAVSLDQCVDFNCGTPTAINEINSHKSNLLFDNSSNTLSLRNDVLNSQLKIFDLGGRLIKYFDLLKGNNVLYLSNIKNGMYVVVVFSEGNIISREKINKY